MQLSQVPNDGFTFKGEIPASGRWAAIKFEYRPALAEEVDEYAFQCSQNPGKKRAKVIGEYLMAHLVSWDVRGTTKEGKPTEDTVVRSLATIRLLPREQRDALVEYVSTYAGEAEAEDAKN